MLRHQPHLARFIRHQLIYAAALPPPGAEALALGEKRYRAFLDTVARMMARDDDEPQKESDDASLVQSASGSGRVGPSSP